MNQKYGWNSKSEHPFIIQASNHHDQTLFTQIQCLSGTHSQHLAQSHDNGNYIWETINGDSGWEAIESWIYSRMSNKIVKVESLMRE